MVGVAWREFWCVCGWQDVGMVICESSVVSFLPCLVIFHTSIPTCAFTDNDFSKTCSCTFLGGGGPLFIFMWLRGAIYLCGND